MRKTTIAHVLTAVCLVCVFRCPAPAQIFLSAGAYSQNFDALATTGTANPWINNVTLPGWYVSKNGTNATSYRAGDGSSNTGDPWSFGVAGVSNLTERAIGSLASGSAATIALGVRLRNDTAVTQTNFVISYMGEQWRSGSLASDQMLAFSYAVSSGSITNASSAATWINFPALNFVSPNLSASSSPLDGNAATNRQWFASVVLIGVAVPPGHELMLRWLDVDDVGFDSGLAIDDLTVSFAPVVPPVDSPPVITVQPQSQTVVPGATVAFTVTATGYPPPTYQWQFNGTNLTDATNATLTLANVTALQSGEYLVVVSNLVDTTNSQAATLTVALSAALPGFSLLTYNVKGNGATDWSTNAPQLQAIARQLQYLQPDIITFNEIPWDLKYEMTNFIAAFLPGYQLTISSGTDGSICSAIASRFAITRATSWLDSLDLRSFGYSNANNATDNFTRDLYEAQINVPGFVRPLHVFTTHLKSSADGYTNAAAKRAAEAAAITNFFATNLFALYPHDPYTLSGDMNESDTNTLALQRLLSPATRLFLTNPKNPGTGSGNTYNSTAPSSRIDYIFPNQLLFANVQNSQVFRTDRLNPQPPNLNSNDGRVASDHLPVLMVFNNPYDQPFKLLSIGRSNASVTLKWESVPGQPYRVDFSTNLAAWSVLASNLTATSNTYSFSTNLNDATRHFRVYRVP